MTPVHRILIVAPTTPLASTLVRWLGEAGHEVVLVTTFAAAKLHLQARPDLVITEIRLGEHNGLHIALRAQSVGIPSLVVGPPDDQLAREVAQLGAAYAPAPTLDVDELAKAIDQLLGTPKGTHPTGIGSRPALPATTDAQAATAAPSTASPGSPAAATERARADAPRVLHDARDKNSATGTPDELVELAVVARLPARPVLH
ncbi:MAG: hypothetical protein ACT4QD_19495 [Acidobacteriota bacterium]